MNLYDQPHGFICEWDSEQVFDNNSANDINNYSDSNKYSEPIDNTGGNNTDNNNVRNTAFSSGSGCNSCFEAAALMIAAAFLKVRCLK